LWDRAPGFVSLLDLMEKFHPVLPAAVFAQFAHFIALFARVHPMALASGEDKANVEAVLFSTAEVLCREAGLTESWAMLERLKSDFALGISNGDARKAVQLLHGVVLNEMQRCNLFLAPKDRGPFHDNPRLFGEAVFDAFPSARMDIREAGSCWLFGRNNAMVYHLMNAAEIGLRALARDRRVSLQRGRSIEFADWGTLIGEVDNAVQRIRSWRASPVRAEAEHFYADALMSVRSFNNGHRTHVNHARGRPYHDDDTRALMGHVERFLRGLARYISETKRTPLVWKRVPPRPSRRPLDPSRGRSWRCWRRGCASDEE
jgi:hypothetical protein